MNSREKIKYLNSARKRAERERDEYKMAAEEEARAADEARAEVERLRAALRGLARDAFAAVTGIEETESDELEEALKDGAAATGSTATSGCSDSSSVPANPGEEPGPSTRFGTHYDSLINGSHGRNSCQDPKRCDCTCAHCMQAWEADGRPGPPKGAPARCVRYGGPYCRKDAKTGSQPRNTLKTAPCTDCERRRPEWAKVRETLNEYMQGLKYQTTR